jgi:hypothetical protein
MPKEPDELQKKVMEEIAPTIDALARKLDARELMFTGFIYDSELDVLIKIGNTTHQGMDLVQLHYTLSMVIARLHAMGNYAYGPDPVEVPEGSSPEELADHLALSLLATLTPETPPEVRERLLKYVQSRHPEKK